MFLTITTTHTPATDLGHLLHKNPARVNRVELSFGEAVIFYPEAREDRCTAAMLVDVDPVALVRGGATSISHYVNDRPYAASSFLSVAIGRAFGTALSGRSKDRQELVTTPLPLEISIASIPCRGGETILRRLFEPLGYEVDAARQPLDLKFPEWGESRYFDVTLRGTHTVHDALSNIYVLIPVLDADKHYWVGDDEVDKLLRHGEGWLSAHPEKNAIARRYLKHKRHLVREAVQRLAEADEAADADEKQEKAASEEETVEKKISLGEQRLARVIEVLKAREAKTVIDLGCGEGRLLRELMRDRAFTRLAGMDVSTRALEVASDKLKMDRIPERQKDRLKLFQGSLVYRDKRLEGWDAATAIEVIEHLDPPRLASFERVVFGEAKLPLVIVTTPNVEFNVKFESLPAGKLRHRDHRFEWTREQFRAWATNVAAAYGYAFEWLPVGEEDAAVGPPTQMAVLVKT